MPTRRHSTGATRSDGLAGRWLSPEEIGQLAFFTSGKNTTKFRARFNANFEPLPGEREPWLKAAVWREYDKGDIICEAGAYGSTAFLLVEGTATAALAERSAPRHVPGRTPLSLARLQRLFRRRTRAARATPDLAAIGEVSRYASISCTQPPVPVTLQPGDVFGVDTCINFYPREATVRADTHCVAVEMLRSVLDTIRIAGAAAEQIESSYAAAAIRKQLHISCLFSDLSGDALERLASHAELLTNDSDAIRQDVIYSEGETADAVYLVRTGTIKVSQMKAGGEVIFAYLGRGAAFGFEGIAPARESAALLLRCTSHPAAFPDVAIRGTATLGRSAACELRFPKDARAVSRRHCRFQVRDEDVYLADLDSDNGTKLNGEEIKEAIVTAGDVITVVDYTFELRRVARDARAAAAAATRVATATGLDNFEIVKIESAALAHLAEDSERVGESVTATGRSFAAVAPERPAPEPGLVADLIELNLYNSQNVLLIDLDRCTRCDECVRACATAHDGIARFTRDGPRVGHYLVTMACRSCTDPKCMIGCPVGSIRRKDSLEIHIEDWCIGCERCAAQCPFGNINMVELAAPVARPSAPTLRATVCDLCAGFDGPNCVYACPHDAAIRVNPGTFLSPADWR